MCDVTWARQAYFDLSSADQGNLRAILVTAGCFGTFVQLDNGLGGQKLLDGCLRSHSVI